MSGQLLCGASKVKITPSEELLPFQFGLIGQQYGRVHDDLFLRVVALESNGRRALIVVYDLDKAPYPAEWLSWLAEQTGVEENYIFYTAIHTHTAPLTGYRPFEGPNFIEQKPPQVQEKVHLYEAFLKDSLLRAAREALGNLTPARMGFATGECRLGVNRCQEYVVRTSSSEELSELNIGVNLEEKPDPTLLVVRFENAENRKTIALLTNYAVHCVAVFQNTCDDGKAFISADIGGAVSVQLEKQYPGCVALWTSAPAGDVNPGIMVQNFAPNPETGAPETIYISGEAAADAILRIASQRQLDAIARTMPYVHCNIEKAPVSAKTEWAVTQYAPGGFGVENPKWRDYEIRLHRLQIGELAFVGVDGELYTSLGQAIQKVSPVKNTFVVNHECSLLLNNPGYIMDDATQERLARFSGRGAQKGGIPGGGTLTKPGTVKAALEDATKRLFEEEHV